MPSSSPRTPRGAVLYLDTHVAEWTDVDAEGHVRLGAAAVQGDAPADLARAAREARASAGTAGRGCVLALGPGFVEQRFLTLPELARGEQQAVLLRKAAAQLDCAPSDALFSARECERRSEGQGEARTVRVAWQLLALRRSRIVPLREALRDAGLRVVRTVHARSAAACAVAELLRTTDSGSEGAAIVVSVEPSAVVVSLVAGDALLNQNVLEGDLSADAHVAAVLIQEIKSYEAYWRRHSRGASIGAVGILGVDAPHGERLAIAVRAALPAATIRLARESGDGPDLGRCDSLAACRTRGPLAVELHVPLRPRRAALASILAALVVLTLGAGVVVQRGIRSEAEDVRGTLARLARETAALETVDAELERVRRLETDVDAAVDSVLGVRASGLPLAELLVATAGACRGRADVRTLSAAGFDRGGLLTLSGRTTGDPVGALEALEGLRADLEAERFVREVEVRPGTRIAADESRGQEFELRARWEEHP